MNIIKTLSQCFILQVGRIFFNISTNEENHKASDLPFHQLLNKINKRIQKKNKALEIHFIYFCTLCQLPYSSVDTLFLGFLLGGGHTKGLVTLDFLPGFLLRKGY